MAGVETVSRNVTCFPWSELWSSLASTPVEKCLSAGVGAGFLASARLEGVGAARTLTGHLFLWSLNRAHTIPIGFGFWKDGFIHCQEFRGRGLVVGFVLGFEPGVPESYFRAVMIQGSHRFSHHRLA